MAATHGNHVETVRALIEAGADINIRDNRLDNPFLYSGAEGRLEILRLTIDAGADTRLTNRFGGTALIPAADREHVEIVRELLTRTDVDVNHVNNLGWTALLEAVILGDGGDRHQQIVQLLIDHGANINIADKDGVTPLEHARSRGFREIEQILLEAARGRDRGLIAAAAGDTPAVQEWLSQGASVYAQDEAGVTALIAAAYRNHLERVMNLKDVSHQVNEVFEHQHRKGQIGQTLERFRQAFIVMGQSAEAGSPAKGAFDDPTAGQQAEQSLSWPQAA